MAISTAAAILGSAVVGGAVASRGASKAARAQTRAAEDAAQVQRDALARQEELSRPYREQGLEAQNALARMAGLGADTGAADYGVLGRQFGQNELITDPGYGFRLREGMRDLDRRLAASGRMFSGGALKAGQQYGQELASQEFQNAFTRAMDLRQQRANALAGLYEGGLRATTGFGQDVGQSAANVGNMLAAGGQARASGYLGQANALSNALGQAATGYGLYRGGYFGDGGMSRQLLDEILPGVTPTGRYGGSSIPYTGRYGTGR